jgi:hypothetical protein
MGWSYRTKGFRREIVDEIYQLEGTLVSGRGWEDVDWINLAKIRDTWRAVVIAVKNIYIR